MGQNPTKNPFRRARLGLDTQAAVDEYKARSVWSAWWSLDERVRRRFFALTDRQFITRYGARLDEIACHRTAPQTDAELHFLRVCIGQEEPATSNERLWILVQLVCRYQRVVERAARADLAEHDAAVLRAENTALKAQVDHLEMYAHRLGREIQINTGELPRSSLDNVRWMSSRFDGPAREGPPPYRFSVCPGQPVAKLTAAGLIAITR